MFKQTNKIKFCITKLLGLKKEISTMCRKGCKKGGSSSASGMEQQRKTPSPSLHLSAPDLLSSLTAPDDRAIGTGRESTEITLEVIKRKVIKNRSQGEMETLRQGGNLWSSGANEPSSF